MFDIYMPIVDIDISTFHLLAIGLLVGFVTALCGVSGIMVPILMFFGIDASTAVANSNVVSIGISSSSAMAYAKLKRVDYAFGSLMVLGSAFGVLIGISIFNFLLESGKLNFFVSLALLILLSCVGTSALKTLFFPVKYNPNSKQRILVDKLPLKNTFSVSSKQISIFVPIFIAMISGISVSLLGLGGGMVLVPLMLYFLKLKEKFVTGTTLFCTTFTASFSAIIHSITSHNVDIIMSALIILGAVSGAQIGVKLNHIVSKKCRNIILAILLLFVSFKIGYFIIVEPQHIYSTYKVL